MNIEQLSIEERIDLVEAVWDSVAAEQTQLPIPPSQRELLDSRLAQLAADGDTGIDAYQALESSRQKL